ncbi:MAG: 2-oxoacid:acceptor oxidoreductase family protein, partial [Methanoculleus sp.]
DEPIKIYSQIHEPDLVIVLDTSIMDVVDVLEGLKDGGAVLFNSAHPISGCNGACRNVDLTGIALAENLVVAGSPILNTPVLGALAKMGVITLPSARAAIQEMFTDERNVKAAEAAYKELKV